MKAYEKPAEELGRQIRKMLTNELPVTLVIAEVEEVNEDEKTMSAIVDDDRVFSDISLDIFQNGNNSLLLVPQVGSLVVLGFIEDFSEQAVLIKTTDLHKIIVTNGTSSCIIEDNKISFASDLIEFNGGNNGGLIFIEDLTAAINDFVKETQNMCSVFNSHTHQFTWAGTGGTAVTMGPASPMQSPNELSSADYQNEKITQ